MPSEDLEKVRSAIKFSLDATSSERKNTLHWLSGNPNILGYRAIHERSSKQCKSQSKKRDGGEKPIPSLRPPREITKQGCLHFC